jgi:hypothetical protein
LEFAFVFAPFADVLPAGDIAEPLLVALPKLVPGCAVRDGMELGTLVSKADCRFVVTGGLPLRTLAFVSPPTELPAPLSVSEPVPPLPQPISTRATVTVASIPCLAYIFLLS